jgi:hypothetical protein
VRAAGHTGISFAFSFTRRKEHLRSLSVPDVASQST